MRFASGVPKPRAWAGGDSPAGSPQTPTYAWWNRHHNYGTESVPDP